MLLAAAFSAFAIVFTRFALGRIPPLALLPFALVALLLALGAARQSALLQLAAVCAGVLCALVGLAVSLVKAL